MRQPGDIARSKARPVRLPRPALRLPVRPFHPVRQQAARHGVDVQFPPSEVFREGVQRGIVHAAGLRQFPGQHLLGEGEQVEPEGLLQHPGADMGHHRVRVPALQHEGRQVCEGRLHPGDEGLRLVQYVRGLDVQGAGVVAGPGDEGGRQTAGHAPEGDANLDGDCPVAVLVRGYEDGLEGDGWHGAGRCFRLTRY